MMTEICALLNNWFDRGQPKYIGRFSISDAALTSDDYGDMGIKEGQYYRIIGSALNDGVWRRGEEVSRSSLVVPTGTDFDIEGHTITIDVDPATEDETDGEGVSVMVDEEFDGAVWLMAVPPAVVALAGEIAAWQAKHGGIESQAMSPYTSESFAGYSYSKNQAGDANGLSGWQAAYASRLMRWKKL